jgi:2-oxoglutarate/2-oxoacid ferredoxin oxidoreductase subunit beta
MIRKKLNIDSLQENTWCPGCLNFITLAMFKKALIELNEEGLININSTVLVTDIGCGAKIYDYVDINAVYSLHGRVIPVAMGIKAARPDLTVIGFAGDGGTYDEGMNHLIHSARKNVGITMLVGNNRVFALTKGQPTSTNDESATEPLDPVLLTGDAGATFLARVSAFDPDYLKETLKKAIIHKGFSLVDIIQPCLIFKNDAEDILKRTYKISDKKETSLEFLRNEKKEIPMGIFINMEKPTWEDVVRRGFATQKTSVARKKSRI